MVAQVAHIRSEKLNGPRHDPDYDEALLNSSRTFCCSAASITRRSISMNLFTLSRNWKIGKQPRLHKPHAFCRPVRWPEIIAALEKVAHAQARRATLRSTWEAFGAAALPFCDHAQGATSRDAEHLSEQLVTDRPAFNVAMAAVLREGPRGHGRTRCRSR